MNVKNSVRTAAIDVIWNLDDLYKGFNDPGLELDIQTCEKEADELAKTYKDKVALLDEHELFALVNRLENLDILLGRLMAYSFLFFITRTEDATASALLQKIEELTSRIGKKTVFFRLEWNQLEDSRANELLSFESLEDYKHYLNALRKFAPHLLSHPEEEILQEISPVGRSAWLVLFEKLMGQIKFGEQSRTEEEVLSDLYHPDRMVRKLAAKELTEGLRANQHILCHIFNTLAAEKMISDRLRKYNSWINYMNMENELEEETVETLINAVASRYDIVARYYSLKAKLLGFDKLYDYDRYAPVPGFNDSSISWNRCREIVLDSFAGFSPRMAEVAKLFFEKNWIHAPVQKGKRSGAFAHPCVPDVHPYLMVNYTEKLRDVSTVAHELGHGIHQYLAADKGYYNSHTPLVLAETASVFAELLVFQAQLKILDNENQRRSFICQKLESIFATVFRQISMNRFEEKMHQGRREHGELSVEMLSDYWLETQKTMFSDSVTLTDDYGIWWSYIPHFLNTPGYVYSYAFGELLVLALYSIYEKQGDLFVERYFDLLSAGGSDTPYNLLKPFDINLTNSSFWLGGLEVIDMMLQQVE